MQIAKAILVLLSFLIASCSLNSKAEKRINEKFPSQEEREFVLASYEGNLTEVERALDSGIDISFQGHDGTDALWWAILGENIEVVEFLLKRGANPNSLTEDGFNIMELCSTLDDSAFLKKCLEYGGDVSLVSLDTGFTPIYSALLVRNHENVKILVEAGADINFKDQYNETPLLQAALSRDYRSAYFLLEAGADPAVVAKAGYDFNKLIKNKRIQLPQDQVGWRVKCLEYLRRHGIREDEEKGS